MWRPQQKRKDSTGKRWNFQIWSDVWTEDRGVVIAGRVFFWDDSKSYCGVVIFPVGSNANFKRYKALIEHLVANRSVREKYRRELCFPLERHYGGYGAFPEEVSN